MSESLDAVWLAAVDRILSQGRSYIRPSPEWFSAQELAEAKGWSRDKADHWLRRNPHLFERTDKRPTWWRVKA